MTTPLLADEISQRSDVVYDEDNDQWDNEEADFRLFGGDFLDDATRALLLADDEPARVSHLPPGSRAALIGCTRDSTNYMELLLARRDVELAVIVVEKFGDDAGNAGALVERVYEKHCYELKHAYDDLVGEAPPPQAVPRVRDESRLERILAKDDVNVIVVCTPLKSRRFFCEQAIEARKPFILCAKPISDDADVIARLRASARENGCQLRHLVSPNASRPTTPRMSRLSVASGARVKPKRASPLCCFPWKR